MSAGRTGRTDARRAIRASLLPGSSPVELDPLVLAPQGEGWAVDGEPAAVALDRHDALHASLRPADPAGGAASQAVVLLPGARPGPPGMATVEVVVDGWRFEVAVEDDDLAALRERARRGRAAEGSSRPAEVRAMIPGRVAIVNVEAGQAVEAGDRLLVIEAMKMQNELRAPRGGVVTRVVVAPGRTVEAGELLAVIE